RLGCRTAGWQAFSRRGYWGNKELHKQCDVEQWKPGRHYSEIKEQKRACNDNGGFRIDEERLCVVQKTDVEHPIEQREKHDAHCAQQKKRDDLSRHTFLVHPATIAGQTCRVCTTWQGRHSLHIFTWSPYKPPVPIELAGWNPR